jgi:hypothetical protein
MIQVLIPPAIAFIFTVGPVVASVFAAAFVVYVAYVFTTGLAREVPYLKEVVPDDPDDVEERRLAAERAAAKQARIQADVEIEIALAEDRARRVPLTNADARLQIADARADAKDAEAALDFALEQAKSMSGQWLAVADARNEVERTQERLDEALEDAKLYLTSSEMGAVALIEDGLSQRVTSNSTAAHDGATSNAASVQDFVIEPSDMNAQRMTASSTAAHDGVISNSISLQGGTTAVIAEGDHDLAKQLKADIAAADAWREKIADEKRRAIEIAALEEQKSKAVVEEDYDLAKRLKLEIESLKRGTPLILSTRESLGNDGHPHGDGSWQEAPSCSSQVSVGGHTMVDGTVISRQSLCARPQVSPPCIDNSHISRTVAWSCSPPSSTFLMPAMQFANRGQAFHAKFYVRAPRDAMQRSLVKWGLSSLRRL